MTCNILLHQESLTSPLEEEEEEEEEVEEMEEEEGKINLFSGNHPTHCWLYDVRT